MNIRDNRGKKVVIIKKKKISRIFSDQVHFNARSRLIENNLRVFVLPAGCSNPVGPYPNLFITLWGKANLPYNKHQFYYFQQSLQATFYQ